MSQIEGSYLVGPLGAALALLGIIVALSWSAWLGGAISIAGVLILANSDLRRWVTIQIDSILVRHLRS